MKLLNLILFFSAAISIIAISSCNKDNDDPTFIGLSIVSPEIQEEFDVLDTIQIVLAVAEVGKTVDVLIEMTDSSGLPIISSGVFEDVVTSSEMSFPFILTDATMDGGLYQLYVWFFHDGIQSLASTQIAVNDLPRELQSVWVVTQENEAQTKITAYDPDFEHAGSILFEGDYAGSDMNSKTQQFAIAGGNSGGLIGYDVNTYEELWIVEAIPNPVQPYFTLVEFFGSTAYAGLWEGGISGYNAFGSRTYSTENQETNFPDHIHFHENYLISANTQKSNISQKWLYVNYSEGGALLNQTAVSFEPVYFLSVTTESLIIFANDENMQLVTWLFYPQTGLLSKPYEPFTLPETGLINCKSIGNTSILLATENTIFEYVFETSLTALFNFENTSAMEYEPLNQTIWLSGDEDIYVMDFDGSILNQFTTDSEVLNIHFLYNK